MTGGELAADEPNERMPVKTKQRPVKNLPATKAQAKPVDAQHVVAELQRRGSKNVRDGMARYAIPSDKAFGISVGTLKTIAKRLGRDHHLALALWNSGWYEARMLAAFIDDPSAVTASQMDRWCREFDNWAIVDTVCFHLFDRTPYAWDKVTQWATRRAEFQRRAAFALLWSLTGHDKSADDSKFIAGLRLIERAADDERNFVKKAVNMALRAIGKRNRKLHAAALGSAMRLAASRSASARWIGSDAARELESAAVTRRLT